MGFDQGSVYSNVFHLLSNSKNIEWPQEIRKSFPWILWRLWKNRNSKIFQGVSFDPLDSLKKIRDDQEEWLRAQQFMEDQVTHSRSPIIEWSRPKNNWLKCNIASSFCYSTGDTGGAWTLRNEEGVVILHSRRSFADDTSAAEASYTVIKWAMQCIADHGFQNIIFECAEKYLVGSINKPHAWPSYKVQVHELLLILQLIQSWELRHCPVSANRPTARIAKSVIRDSRTQSYLARGHPVWLQNAFQRDRVLSSLS